MDEMERIYERIKDDVIEENGVIFRRMMPLDAPDCHYPGLMQKQIIYKKGYQFSPGRRVVEEDMICDSDVEILVGDEKLKVYADVYRPITQEKVPAILCIGYGGKRDTNNKSDNMPNNEGKPIHWNRPLSGLQGWESLDPAEWVPYGYALVNVDPTGVCASEGNMRIFGDEDRRNGHDIIEAIAQMDWCTGKVGLAGSSWLAMVQFSYASTKPEHLVCIAPFEAEADPYRDEYVRGGIPLVGNSFSLSYRTHGNNYMEHIGAMALKYPLINEYWEQKAMRHEEIDIPAFVVGSYTSPFHTRGTPDGFNRLASKEKWYRVHNTTEWLDLYTDAYMADLKKFFDHYLKGADNGWTDTPRVRVGLLDPGGENVYDQPETEYPPARMKPMRFYLDPEAKALRDHPVDKASSASYSADNRECFKLKCTIDRDIEIMGTGKLRLWVSAEGNDDMDLFVKYAKLDQNGERLKCDVGMGYYYGPDGKLRVSHRELDEEKSTEVAPVQKHKRMLKLSPGEIVPVDILIWPTGMIFHKGETLELTISSRDFNEDRPPNMVLTDNLNKGIHTVYGGGQYDSYLVIQACERK